MKTMRGFWVRLTLFGALIIMSSALGYSQGTTNRTISGFVTDVSSGEPVFQAKIYDTVSRIGAIANEYGFYSITLPSKEAVLRISAFGSVTLYATVPANQNELDISLVSEVQDFEEVEVKAESLEKTLEETNSGTIDLQLDKVDKLPTFFGEKDVVKTLQLLPGVSSGGEGSSGLYVRGGGPDQNLILLDGVPVYNASHLFGFFSVFNNDALSKVTMIKGGFPARYGGRTSSVLDMRMKEGNMKKYNVEGSIGLIASRILVEGPIKKDKTAFIFSARRTYIDLLTKPFMVNAREKGGYYFYDMNAKVHHKINKKHHIYLSGYFGQDRAQIIQRFGYTSDGKEYDYDDKSGLGWGNAIVAARWNYRIGPKIFMNTTATFSHYKFDLSNQGTSIVSSGGVETENKYLAQYYSNILDWSGKTDFTYIPNARHYIRFGAGNTYHTFKPGVFTSEQEVDGKPIDTGEEPVTEIKYANEAFVYIEDDHKITDWLKINYGLHLSSFFVDDQAYNSLQPRISGNTILTKKSSLKFSYAYSTQFIHLLSNTGIGLPTDLWVPSTAEVGPINSHQGSLGYNQILGDKYNLVLEGYYKTMEGVIQYKEGIDFIGTGNNWESKIERGKGWSYGGELFVEKKVGKMTGWVGYTLSWTDRQFENINGGEKFPYTYDRRHDLSVAASYEINEKWDIGVVFVMNTGRAVSLPTQQYGLANNPISPNYWWGSQNLNYLNSVNGYRMPTYHRLDLGANYHKQKKWGESIWSFSLYNAYSRLNPFYLYVGTFTNGDKKLIKVALFPIIPSVSWKFKITQLNRKNGKK